MFSVTVVGCNLAGVISVPTGNGKYSRITVDNKYLTCDILMEDEADIKAVTRELLESAANDELDRYETSIMEQAPPCLFCGKPSSTARWQLNIDQLPSGMFLFHAVFCPACETHEQAVCVETVEKVTETLDGRDANDFDGTEAHHTSMFAAAAAAAE